MNTLPQDPFLLYGFVNMKLRDEYPSLESFCDDYGVSKESLDKTLNACGFYYDEKNNRYV